jgi:hypothetical protein
VSSTAASALREVDPTKAASCGGVIMRITTLVVALAVSAGIGVSAQRDLSGTWRLDEARSGSSASTEQAGPVSRIIRMLPNSVEIDVTQGAKTSNFRYPLTASKPGVIDAAASSNRAYWDGERLITETVQAINGQTVTMREEMTLEADVNEMVVRRVVEVQHGYEIRGGKNNSMARDVFVRVMP